MNNYYNGKILPHRIFITVFVVLLLGFTAQSQNYPDQVQLPNVNYQDYQEPTTPFPDYLSPFTEDISGSTIIRISDAQVFGTTSQRLRHNYSVDQTWNSDETLIKLAGYPAAILDAETYEFLYWSNIPSYGRWSNVQPNIIFGTSGNSFVSHDVNTNQRTTLHTFSEYASIDFGYGESNQDNFDRYVGLIGRSSNGDRTLIVYDIQNDIVSGSLNIGVTNELDWFAVSQLGNFAVAQYKDNGPGPQEGVKSYSIDMTNERHIYNHTEHGDLGIDAFGNEVVVEYGGEDEWNNGYSLYMARLDGGGVTQLFPYVNGRGIWGGHISCRNIERPGWAYISEQCCSSNPVAPREIFAIKLDGSGIIERYAKHHAAPASYLHETQLVPNRNGTKIIFASNWSDPNVINQNSPPAFVLEFPQSNVGMSVNAGNDVQICEGANVTLTATGTGGTNYLWSTGQTSSSITVSPNVTTNYTVTLSDDSGNSVSDEVSVIVNSIPIANAGTDTTINEGQSFTLTASGGSSYEWNTGETTQSITVSPIETTTYSVTVSSNGCSSEPDDITVTVIPTPLEANAGEDVSICLGENIVLTASGGLDYLWSTGETSQSITVNPQSTTTYIVTVSEGNESDSDSVVVTVHSIPIANAGNDVTINEGESTTLTASGGSNYEWNTGETTQSITVSPTETITYSVIVSNNGCLSEPDDITVTVIPAPVQANAGQDVAICQGESTVLTASGGSNYLWSNGESTQSITVSPQSTTIYSVTVSEGNESDSDSVIVTVNPVPIANAGNDVSINEGESTTLTASGGSNYEWNTGETTQSITVSPTENMTYLVVVSDNGCSSEADSVIVTVIPDSTTVNANAGQDVAICQGESTVLTASGGSNYLWSNGETTQSITVNPQSTTTYSVTVSEGNTSDIDSVVVIVNPIPIANASNDVTINEGESTTLTVSGGSSYEWNTGDTTQSITVSPSQTTTYSVIVSNNGCTSEADTITVTVEPNSTSVTAYAGEDVTICQYDMVTLTATGGISYVWNTGETSSSITVSPLSTTTYTVTASNGQSYDTDSVQVTVNPQPIAYAGEDETIELGESITLTAEGGNSYLWSNGSTAQNISVYPTETTNYSVTVSIGNCSDTDDIRVTVLEPIIAYAGEDAEVCNGESITLTASGGNEYLWNTGETTQSIIVTPEISTEYDVMVSNGIQSASDSVLVTVNACEEDNIIQESEIIIYPNPAQSEITIKVSGYLETTYVKIYDLLGRQVKTEGIANEESEIMTKTINVSRLPRGIFVLTINQNGETYSKRIILN